MTKRVHTAISLYPEDIEKLDELAEAAGLNRSNFIRVLIRNEHASKEGKLVTTHNAQYEEEKTSDESEGPDEVGDLGAFSTKKLPRLGKTNNWVKFYDWKYWAYLWVNCEHEDMFYFEDMMNHYAKEHRFTATAEELQNVTNIDMKKLNRENYS